MDAQQSKNEEYKRKTAFRNIAVVLIFSVLLILSSIVNMNTGYSKLSPLDTLRMLFDGDSSKENLILFGFRLPRIVISMLVGAGLASSGCIIRGVSCNALADPGLLGINAGAGLIVILFAPFFDSQSHLSVLTLPFLVPLGSGSATILICALAYKREGGLAPARLILTGVAVQAGFSALITVPVVKLDETQFDFVATWQAKNIWGSNRKFVLALLPQLLPLILYMLSKSRALDVLSLGDNIAYDLDTSVERERRRLLISTTALAASCVAVSGSISFVGLITSHLARQLVGPCHRILLSVCVLAGAVLVSVSGTVARVIAQPFEIPTGIMAAIIGAPYFLYLLVKNRQ